MQLTPDYASTYFEFPTLDKIHGEPTYNTLKTLKKQLKANGMSVLSDLGGGQFGHLGLVLSPAEYALISNVPYVRPQHPGPLIIPAGTAHHEAVRLRADQDEHIRVFRETLQVERALIKQIVAAVDPEYLRELRDELTNTIILPVPEILDHLITCYGQVDSEALDKEEQKMKTYLWNISDPPVHFFNKIEELASMAIAAHLAKSPAQIVSLALDVVRRTGDLEKGLIEWLTLPAAQQTWVDFKQHFNTAWRELKRIRGPSMRNTAFHQAHQVASDLTDNFNQMRDDIVQSMHALTLHHRDIERSLEHEPPPDATPAPTPAPSMNSTNDTNAQLLRVLQQMQEQLTTLSNPNNGRTNGRTRNDNSQRSMNRDQRNQPRTPRSRSNISKYCWTHGACAHDSRDCNNKAPGHKDDATFANKLGGSTLYCPET